MSFLSAEIYRPSICRYDPRERLRTDFYLHKVNVFTQGKKAYKSLTLGWISFYFNKWIHQQLYWSRWLFKPNKCFATRGSRSTTFLLKRLEWKQLSASRQTPEIIDRGVTPRGSDLSYREQVLSLKCSAVCVTSWRAAREEAEEQNWLRSCSSGVFFFPPFSTHLWSVEASDVFFSTNHLPLSFLHLVLSSILGREKVAPVHLRPLHPSSVPADARQLPGDDLRDRQRSRA